MKLYDKKFLIYENCMIRSFGQPGKKNRSKLQKMYVKKRYVKFQNLQTFFPNHWDQKKGRTTSLFYAKSKHWVNKLPLNCCFNFFLLPGLRKSLVRVQEIWQFSTRAFKWTHNFLHTNFHYFCKFVLNSTSVSTTKFVLNMLLQVWVLSDYLFSRSEQPWIGSDQIC